MANDKRRGDAPTIYPLGHPRNGGTAVVKNVPQPHTVRVATPVAPAVAVAPATSGEEHLTGETTQGPPSVPTATPPAAPATPAAPAAPANTED